MRLRKTRKGAARRAAELDSQRWLAVPIHRSWLEVEWRGAPVLAPPLSPPFSWALAGGAQTTPCATAKANVTPSAKGLNAAVRDLKT